MSADASEAWRALARDNRRPEVLAGLDALWLSAAGTWRRISARSSGFQRDAARIAAWEPRTAPMSAAALRQEIDATRALFRSGRDVPEDRIRAFALIREAARRELGMHPFPVQLAGALAMASGCIAEMATGEGKTLAAVFPATLAAWRGRGCHIVTVNDYLAHRDAEWMAPLYRACGVRAAWIVAESSPQERRAAYSADVTYCTNKEVAADFLRDRLVLGSTRSLGAALAHSGAARGRLGALVMRGLECAIVDEADSVLIDEAVTPLIISSKASGSTENHVFLQADEIARGLANGRHFRVDERRREARLTSSGRALVRERAHHLGGIWAVARRAEELIVQAITARELYQRGHHYLVRDNTVVIVDDFTGRAMPDRAWRHGLHQAVEAKESLHSGSATETRAGISFQRFFRLYRSLSGMTGTGREVARELWRTYRLPVVSIPRNRPERLRRLQDRVFASSDAKWPAVIEEIEAMHALGRPVLVGARTIAQSERVSALLAQRGLAHRVLNAQNHAEEADIVARAGEPGALTIATNMAGRGTDIRLGNAAAEKGGLHVLAVERHESSRIDRQLFGRAGRQGDPGSARAIISLEDELLRRYGPHPLIRLATRLYPRRAAAPWARTIILLMAQARASAEARRNRAAVLRADEWFNNSLGFSSPT